MIRLIGYGLLAALFFSSTFVLNRAMSLDGGDWVWSAVLRYGYTLLFILLGFVLSGRGASLRAVWTVFRRHWLFWIGAGCVGYGVFYTGITFAANYAPAWVVATTWQTTILATPIVLAFFGRRVPLRGIAFTLLIFVGVVLVNYENAAQTSWQALLLGALPVLVAAFAYPLGVHMVWEAHSGNGQRIAEIDDAVLDNPFARVLLLVLGSIPWWIGLIMLTQPPPPTNGQWVNAALVALSSGIIASALFLHARHLAATPYALAAVDSTQSAEVVFSLLGEVLLLGGLLPGVIGWLGLALTVAGMALYLLAQGRLAQDEPDALEPLLEPQESQL
jgi:drug/metabolite transporter (DMT)-like permease